MIWFFLAGFISGAVGVMMFAHWWIHTHATVIQMDEEPIDEDSNDMDDEEDNEDD